MASNLNVEESLAVTEKFNITVTPVNDQPPLIRIRAPSMKVVVGERVALGPDSLEVSATDYIIHHFSLFNHAQDC